MRVRAIICLVVLTSSCILPIGCTQEREPCECDAGAAAETPAPTRELYALPGLDHGLLQSPVNILSEGAVHGKHRIALHFDHAAPEYLLNKGSTIELEFPEGGGSITYDGQEFELRQLHFHTPSEHQIDGITYPLEMHIVHRMREAGENGRPHYLVIAILFRMGEGNHFIGTFLEAVPPTPGASTHLEPGTVYLDEIFPDSKIPKYFHYRGSLTTPPHTETVHWLVLKDIQQASPEQIQRINTIEGDNARHVQALYGRPIDD